MLIIGVTGGIGSGKTTVTNRFTEKGIHIVDSDIIAREVVAPNSPALEKIKSHFGTDITLPDNSLNRKKLRSIIFSDEKEKTWLESLLHPIIHSETQRQLHASQSAYTILVSPLLLESQAKSLVDRILVVDIPEQHQASRASERDNSSTAEIQKIIDSQMPRQKRLQFADDVVDNSGSIEATHKQVDELHTKYLTLTKLDVTHK